MKKYAQKNIKAISSFMHFCRRTPPGVRGLKYVVTLDELAAGNINGVKIVHLADFLLSDTY